MYLVEDDAEVLARVHRHLADREQQARAAVAVEVAAGYDATDLSVLFGAWR